VPCYPLDPRAASALGSFRDLRDALAFIYVGLVRYNFAAKRPNYLPTRYTQLPSAASCIQVGIPIPIPVRLRAGGSRPTAACPRLARGASELAPY
jgi:hypothetical protein